MARAGPQAATTEMMDSKRLLSALSWTYTAGYLAYVFVAGIKTWPTMTWSAWWSDLALQAAWDALVFLALLLPKGPWPLVANCSTDEGKRICS